MDRPTDGQTDRPSYRDARTHLKMIGSGVGGIELVIDGLSKKGNGGTDGRMDRPSYRDARMHLKMIGGGVGGIELVIDGFLKKGNNQPTDRPTDGQTDPHIGMQGRI